METENNFYVYGHYLKETDALFYIGKGKGGRYKDAVKRTKKWKQFISGKIWYSIILFDNLSSCNALAKESELIKNLKPEINQQIRVSNPIDLKLLSETFSYSKDSETGLVFKSNGKTAGYLKYRNGTKLEISLNFQGRSLRAHRVIWFLVHGEYLLEHQLIDHMDGNPHNNLIDNLRVVTSKTNSQNRCKGINNKSGVTGVCYIKVKNLEYYRARVKCDNVCFDKYFSVERLGKLTAFELAVAWRKENLLMLNKNGENYTERHGK